jgi:hypothetical protein
MQDVLVAATPTIVAALLAAAGVWLRNRSGAQRSARNVEQARSRIAVITSVLDAYTADPTGTHAEARDQLFADLRDAYQQVRGAEQAAQREADRDGATDLTRAVLLLDSRPATLLARVAQVVYYLSLAWALLWLAAAMMFGLVGAVAETEETLGTRLATSFGITVLALAIGLAPAVVLHLVARLAAGSGDQDPPRGPRIT